jgi:hypothetical protein
MEYSVEQIKEKLMADNVWLERGILAIYEYQTSYEQRIEGTVEHNNVGFNSCDGQILSSFAKWIKGGEKYGKPMGSRLSIKQAAIARKKMAKYAGQLYRIAHGDN